MKIEPVNIDDPRVQKIADGLDRHSEELDIPTFDSEPFAFIASDQTSEFLGGVKGKITAGWCELSWLYSTKQVKGTGSELMHKIESYAKENNCAGIIVETLEYQAPNFYKKFGFEIFGEIPDYFASQKLICLLKRFSNDTY